MDFKLGYTRKHKISWFRQKGLALLSVGTYTYSTDPRFQAIYDTEKEDWILEIHSPNVSDTGFYECQISTNPPQSIVVSLTVQARRTQHSTRNNEPVGPTAS
ncbi:unnamed protein product [Cyprideis torosa]|uniref:Immunoglobulin V-set domain-containing protein n=1 Tax=Cyprideis torosa TaxID=163714 RepID=A0A7R8ZIC8_9CRUS|nr:unnamed protein product [Cyprideis torosa]CAG0885816.1 unnamed protein product [Cyprideis torosa]